MVLPVDKPVVWCWPGPGTGNCWSIDREKATREDSAKVTRSGGVFRDLGFSPEAEHLLIRSDLMIKIEKLLTARHLKQAEVAKIMGVTQPRVSDLLRGRIELSSTDALIDMLARLGVSVRLVFAPSRSRVA
jgi:predicted XRE-type DNA-binding protein